MNTARFAFAVAPSKIAMATALALTCTVLPANAQEAGAADAQQSEAVPAAQPGIPVWGIEDAELTPDASIEYGVLENGMRYALKRNSQPAGEASLRFLFEVGTRDERDDEEGAAHFVEHMAFNGSTNIPEGELVPKLERLGLAFGADTNAETYPHYTMYKLDLPKLDEETLSSSLDILREMASELTIASDAVEREKGIILSEFQVRNSPDRRRGVQFLGDVLGESRLADRAVAEPEATNRLTAESLRDFYEGYYRPERATLVVVGDFDPAEMKRRIAARFSDWQPSGEARANFAPTVADIDGIKIATFVDPASPEIIDLQRVVPDTPTANTSAEFRGELLDQIAVFAITTRLGNLAKEENARTLGGQVLVQDLFQAAKAYGLLTIAKDGEWRTSLEVAEQEWRRAAEFGFTNSEVAQALANLESAFVTAAAQSNSVRSADIASALAISSLENAVQQSPEQQLALYRQVSPTLTPAAVQENFVAKWGEGPSYAMLATKTAPEDAQQAIASVLEESGKVALSAPVEVVDKPFAYTDFGPAGEIVSDESIADLGIRMIEFSNGVQLNLKKTGFEPRKVSVQVEVGTGLSTLESDLPGLSTVARFLSGADDLGQHEASELQRILSGRQVGYGYGAAQESIVLSASTTPDDLLLQLQLMAGQITDTAFSDQVQRQWVGVAPILATNTKSNPQALFGSAFEAILAGGDSRLGLIDSTDLEKRSINDLKAVVGSQFAAGHIELGIVGDFEEEAVIAAVASTLGALDRPAALEATVRPVQFLQDRSIQTLFHTGQPEQGTIALSWPTDDGLDLKSTQTRRLLGELIELRALEVLREELGATYTPNAISSASLVYDGFGHISLIAPATPESMDDVSRAIRGLVAEFAAAAPDADALLRARQPILESYERSEGTNDGWVGLVVDAQSAPVMLDRRRMRAEVLSAITPADIQAAALQYLVGEPVEIRVVPEVSGESAN